MVDAIKQRNFVLSQRKLDDTEMTASIPFGQPFFPFLILLPSVGLLMCIAGVPA